MWLYGLKPSTCLLSELIIHTVKCWRGHIYLIEVIYLCLCMLVVYSPAEKKTSSDVVLSHWSTLPIFFLKVYLTLDWDLVVLREANKGGREGSLYLCGCIDFSGSVSGVSISMTEVNKWLLPWATERQDRKSCLIFSFKQRPNIASLRCCQAYLIHTHCSIHTHPHVYLAGNGEGSRLLWLW